MNSLSASISGLVLIVTAASAAPQSQGEIEVASIKPSKPGAVVQDSRMSFPPGRFEARNVTLWEILNALNGFTGRVEGGPKWAQSDRYDIIAKLDGNIAPPQRGHVVLALLKDRFKLAIHQAPREESGLALTIGKKQPTLIPAKEDEPTKVTTDAHKAVFQAAYMIMLTNYLRQMLHIPVVDRTGMNTKFDFALDMESAAEEPNFSDRVRAAVEQLGFRLQPTKVTLDITVIDHAERPTEN